MGKSTSSVDGIGVAWAVCEELLARKCFTLFATHYNELTDIADMYPAVKNVSLRVEKKESARIFRHKVQEGATELFADNYGIYIAERAAFPKDIIEMARQTAKKIRSNREKAKLRSGNLQNKAYYQLVQDLKNLASSSLDLDGKRRSLKFTPRFTLPFS